MKKMYFALMIIGLVLTSCGGAGNPAGQANDICGCIDDTGIKLDGVKDPEDLDRKMDSRMNKLSEKEKNKLGKCIAGVLEDVKDDMGDMKDEQKSEYIREFFKAAIDSDCTEKLMKDMEYDELEDMLEASIGFLKGKDGTSSFGGDASSDAGPDVYYNDERGYDAVERGAPSRGDYEDYYDDGGYGDYGTEEAEAEDYYEEEVESIDFDF